MKRVTLIVIYIMVVVCCVACNSPKARHQDYSTIEKSMETLFDSIDGEGSFLLDAVEMGSKITTELVITDTEYELSAYLAEVFRGEWSEMKLSEEEVQQLLGVGYADATEVKIGGQTDIQELTYYKGDVFFMVVYSDGNVTKTLRYEDDSIMIHPDGGFLIIKN